MASQGSCLTIPSNRRPPVAHAWLSHKPWPNEVYWRAAAIRGLELQHCCLDEGKMRSHECQLKGSFFAPEQRPRCLMLYTHVYPSPRVCSNPECYVRKSATLWMKSAGQGRPAMGRLIRRRCGGLEVLITMDGVCDKTSDKCKSQTWDRRSSGYLPACVFGGFEGIERQVRFYEDDGSCSRTGPAEEWVKLTNGY